MTNISALAAVNARRWANAKLTRGPEFVPVAQQLCQKKDRFLGLSSLIGNRVPWFAIAVIKQREAGDDPRWTKSIAQGQPWNVRSTIVPKGRGPFKSWEESGIDALVNCAPFAARNPDWSIGGLLTLLEQYNGLGYAARGLPSPYIWSGTDQYRSGKYVSDGVFNPNVVDAQLGCAGLLLAMQQIDPSIQFSGSAAGAVVAKTQQPVVPVHPSSAAPSIANPVAGSVGAKLSGLFSSIFKGAA